MNDTSANHKKYQSQIATLTFNIKRNSELCSRLLKKTLTIPVLAIMNSDQLASKELQRETAEMIARAEKQSILVTDDGPRLRRTHKGEELIGDDGFAIPSDETPSGGRRPTVGRESAEEEKPALPPKGPPVRTSSIDRRVSHSPTGMHIDTQGAQQSPRQGADFDINKVFSTVKSPTAAHHRRPSVPVPIGPANGPGFDPEVDRLLQDDTNESPPYSPTEESDPDIIWRGSVVMTSLADFPAVAKHAGGGNLQKTLGIPWSRLIPRRLVVAGRIDEQKATVYLCSLRFSLQTDLVVVSLHGTTESSKRQLKEVVDYFVSKKRYGVIAEKLQSNVRDTYLVPVPAGTGNYPEFMLNLSDNFIPQTRTEDMLLLVFVYRNDPEEMERSRGPDWQQKLAAQAAANNGQPGYVQRVNSIPGPSPAFSPTSPQVPFPPQDGAAKPPTYPYAAGHPAQAVADPGAAERRAQAQAEGEALARQVLGPLAASPTINFLMPQAYQMTRVEWEVIKDLYETDPRTRDDLNHLSQRLEQRPPNVGAGNRAYTAP